jgi:hypothetical protein
MVESEEIESYPIIILSACRSNVIMSANVILSEAKDLNRATRRDPSSAVADSG